MAEGGAGDMVKCSIEPLEYMLLTGLPDLTFEAWQELEQDKQRFPYAPDWQRYQRMEDTDGLRFFSLREGDFLLGYASIVISHDEHRSGVLMGYFNDVFVTKPKRGHAAFLVRCVETTLSGIGVQRIQAAQKLNLQSPNTAGEFFKLLDYQPYELVLSKVLH